MRKKLKNILKSLPVPLTKNHLYDIQTRKIIKNHLRPDSNCVDVGCHEGEILDLMVKAAPMGKHYGFEPIPSSFQTLATKYKNRENCIVLNLALSNERGVSEFNHVISNPSYSGLRKREYDKKNEEDHTIQVETQLLDNVIPAGLKIDLIKIDVEGAELLVLEGAEKTISENKPLVIFEHGLGASEFYDSTPEKVFAFFDKLNMQISTLSNFLKNTRPLSLDAFKNQYHSRENYYFIAYSAD
jgi:FkbM family methyltransferase